MGNHVLITTFSKSEKKLFETRIGVKLQFIFAVNSKINKCSAVDDVIYIYADGQDKLADGQSKILNLSVTYNVTNIVPGLFIF